jgi:DNA primase catalytic core
MARIAGSELERLKREISVERLAEARGVALKKHGSDLIGLCPFHDDREPSLVITPDKNLWHCLGACQAGGTVIDWVMKAEGVSFRHAVEVLRKDIPSLAAEPSKRRPPKRTELPKLRAVVDTTASDAEVMAEVVAYYEQTLLESPEALAYLEKRGLRNDEAIKHFRLGFANRTLSYRLPSRNQRTGAELRSALERLGIFRASGHEHLNGSLVIPVFDASGRAVGMYGRKITSSLRRGTPLHLYLPGPHRGIWNASGIEGAREVILCESLIDALTFWCAGFRNVTTAYGIEGFTDELRAALVAQNVERVLIAYDRDDAGDRAAEKLARELAELGVGSARVLFPKGMDANEYALKVGPASQSLGLVLRQAQWMHEGKERSEAAAIDTHSEAELDMEATKSTESAAPHVALHPDVEPHPSLAAEPRAEAPQSEPAPASGSTPPAPDAKTPEAESEGDDVVFRFGDRRWRVRGLDKNTGPEQLRVNLLVARDGGGFHVDTLELYAARQRAVYVKLAAEELGLEERVVKHELGQVLLALEERQEAEKLAAQQKQERAKLSDADRNAALKLLRSPGLCDQILEDFRRMGIVGEETNKLVGYLAATSRKLDEPLAVIIQSSSAAGKSSLMDAVLSLMPLDERVQYSAMTGQSLFYMGESDLAHKILAIVEEEGAERASYALKLLQSEGELTIASTGKDPATGRLVTQEYRVQGPVMIFLTTTAIEVDEELLNRCIVLTVDEGREQTRAIHERQRQARTLGGVVGRQERLRLMQLHQNAQRLLRPLSVVNPYAEQLTFPDHRTRMRRDHTKYLGLIDAIALLHQYQRPVKEVEHRGAKLRYVEVTKEDIALANRLTQEVLGRSLDELPPQTRRLLGLVDAFVTAETKRLGLDQCDYRFSRRELRDSTGWGDTQLRVHLGRLLELEYVLVHRGRQGQSYVYELCWSSKHDSGTSLAGLVDAETLDGATTISTSRGSDPNFAGGVRGGCGGDAGGVRGSETKTPPQENSSNGDRKRVSEQNARRGNGQSPSSYVRGVVAARRADVS